MPLTFDAVLPALRSLTGREPASWTPVTEGAYSPCGRWVVRWEGGGSAFVKAEESPDPAHGVLVEHLVYSSVSLPCVPRLYAYRDGVLVTEDLSRARWGTPVTEDDARALVAAIDLLADVPAPEGLHPLGLERRWAAFAADPARVLGTGLVDEAWLSRWVGDLAEAESSADASGDRLVHGDVWLQNWCRNERGVVLVDWAGCGAGNTTAMRAFGEAAVRAAAGPHGVVLAGEPAWAAWMAGQVAHFLTDAGSHTVNARLVETERRESLATLHWACDEVGLPYPPVAPEFADLGPWRP